MTVSDQIIEVLNYLGEKLGIAIDWSSENVIPYITQLATKLVTWEIWSSVAWIGIMTAFSIVGIIYMVTRDTTFYEAVMNDEVFHIFASVATVVILVVAIGIIGTQIFDIIKCVTFPEMYVFEYIQGLINSAK